MCAGGDARGDGDKVIRCEARRAFELEGVHKWTRGGADARKQLGRKSRTATERSPQLTIENECLPYPRNLKQ